jgi:hypothetical protein
VTQSHNRSVLDTPSKPRYWPWIVGIICSFFLGAATVVGVALVVPDPVPTGLTTTAEGGEAVEECHRLVGQQLLTQSSARWTPMMAEETGTEPNTLWHVTGTVTAASPDDGAPIPGAYSCLGMNTNTPSGRWAAQSIETSFGT